MALISLSDWLDRFGGVEPRPSEPGLLDSIRFAVTEAEERFATPTPRRGLRQRLGQALRRAFWQRSSAVS